MNVLFNDNLDIASYPFVWNTQDSPSGMYLLN